MSDPSFFRMLCLWLCLVVAGIGLTSVAQASELVIDDHFVSRNAAIGLQYIRDESGTLTWQELLQVPDTQWSESTREIPAFGYDKAAYWLKLPITNNGTERRSLVLEIAYPILGDVQTFQTQHNQLLADYHMGNRFPFEQRPIEHRNFIVPLYLNSAESSVLLVRIQTETSVQIPLTLWDREYFFTQQQHHMIAEGLYFGIILVMAVYNLFIFITVRHIAYVYYVGSVLGVATLLASMHGIGFQYVWPNAPHINQWVTVISLCSFITFAALFTNSLLETRINSPRFYYALYASVCINLALIALTPVLPYVLAIKLASLLATLSSLVAIAASLYLLLKGIRTARYYFLAYSFLVFGGILLAANKFGFLPRNFFTEYAVQYCSVIEIILLSFALADRINEEKRKTFLAQNLALENEKKARSEQERYLQLEYKAHLEDMEARQTIIAAEAESRAKSDFLATMSHEIRTPMNGMLGMANLLQDTDLAPQQRQYLDVITHSGKALLNIINDILDYSKIAAGKMELEQIDFDLDKLCLECASVFAVNAESKQLDLLCSLAPATPRLIQSDPTRLRQIILNLLGNAFKFTKQGTINLRVSMIENATLRFDIEDSGIGISDAAQARLFQAFSQADTTTTREFGGTGLGLTISRRLVELMGGTIGVTSQIGVGSTFWFTLPYQPAQPDFVAAHQINMAPLRNKKILIADASAAYCQMLQEQAQMWGMDTLTTCRGDDLTAMALDAAQQNTPFDWIVLGNTLTDQDGLACAQDIFQHPALRHSQCVLLASVTHHLSETHLAQAGIRLVISRPASATVLRNALLQIERDQLDQTVPAPGVHIGSDLRRKTILVVEDNAVNQMVIAGMLKKLGLRYDIAANGELALLQLIKDHRQFDLVLMDCEMPVMDGYTATQALRTYEQENHLPAKPVIALTAHVMQEHLLKAQTSGMDDHLGKPLEFDILSEKLYAWLGSDAAPEHSANLAK